MKKIFRDKKNEIYWEDRWGSVQVDLDGFKNLDIYPIKYAQIAIEKKKNSKDLKILEAGCGVGRVYFHYKNIEYDIFGVEYSKTAVSDILKKDKSANLIQSDISKLPYNDSFFDIVFAFGLYHNIENLELLKKSFEETKRVLKKGGLLVTSIRFDSLKNKLIEYIVKRKTKNKKYESFHRWHFYLDNLKNFMEPQIEIEKVFYVRIVSFLFKFDIFRNKELKKEFLNENQTRVEGFRLNSFGRKIDDRLYNLFPKHFSNLIVVIGRKY